MRQIAIVLAIVLVLYLLFIYDWGPTQTRVTSTIQYNV